MYDKRAENASPASFVSTCALLGNITERAFTHFSLLEPRSVPRTDVRSKAPLGHQQRAFLGSPVVLRHEKASVSFEPSTAYAFYQSVNGSPNVLCPLSPKLKPAPKGDEGIKENYDLTLKMGEGRYASVWLSRDKLTNEVCALKIMKVGDNETLREQLRMETKIHSRLSHPNIIGFRGALEDKENMYVLVEPASGNLFQVLKRRGSLPEDVVAKYVCQIAKALIYLHENGIVHRDIKPENILLSTSGEIKLADFGSAVEGPWADSGLSVSTLDYRSPEIVAGERHTYSTDVWSLGVLVHELLTGRPPFEVPSEADTCARISAVQYTCPQSMSAEAKDLIGKLLLKDPEARLSLKDLLNHPYIVHHTAEQN
mmetsp:Transcript_19151/g.31340  ORF Transcript_19151/g.31340 Transcript_19151/m.31340 type:complete len:370 (+) Transcript_19151:184-1293(+)|eukprot:CAMPEP_0184645870 /NCGR_PEP_ID=MMETSP0308-20130426/2423_1 /TAXON_ID=38269 /ORGANISM="Gloeochaete witrockiana, Strain SAG 46.84" /LENGTH=369 /DNA_ID=CAMNT_0027075321 /DNA_START=62 /DNA_END=1171 /DNA_ORIENTATION=+